MISEKPRIGLSVVRSSWAMLARNRVLTSSAPPFCLYHRFVRQLDGGFGLLFRGDQREPGIGALQQGPELRTVVLEQRFAFPSMRVNHGARPRGIPCRGRCR